MQDKEFEASPQAERLVDWFTHNGGHLSSDVRIVHSASHGYHMRALRPLTSPVVVTCPLHLTLSCLNLDPNQKEVLHVPTPLQQCRGRIPDHILTYLFLIEQRSKGTESPWHAYIDCLPAVESMTTPLWFDDEDMIHLTGTSLAPAAQERKKQYRQQHDEAIAILKELNISLADQVKFETLLWAATIFTSRAFISTHILPGQETVPVLFPVVDILNHSVTAKAEWDFQPHKSFALKILDGDTIVSGQELFNNYAPKQNDELLLGYGFCLENNPIEQFALKLASPVPVEYARELGFLEPHNVPFGMDPGFLKHDQSTEQQFLRAKGHPFGRYENNVAFFCGIPPYIIHSFFMQTLLTLDIDINTINVQQPGARITIHILALLHHAISQRSASLPITTSLTPQNEKQKYAKIYRDGQAQIIHSIRLELETALTEFRTPSKENTPSPLLLSFPEALAAFANTSTQPHLDRFAQASKTHDLTTPQDASLLWTLLLITSMALSMTSSSTSTASPLPPYLHSLTKSHPLPALEDGISDAETYTFIDDHLGDFVRLPSADPDASATDVLDGLGVTFVHGADDADVFVKGKTENLGVRLVMWGMRVVESGVVPVWNGEEGKVDMCLFVGGEGSGDP